MNPKVYGAFERFCNARKASGRVLEIGAVPGKNSLLSMQSLSGATEKVGINIEGPFEHEDFRILRLDANDMNVFEDDYFDTVLCNGVLEHDRFFWKTLVEIRRVARPGALVVIGMPGYMQFTELLPRIRNSAVVRATRKLRWQPFVPRIFRSTLTLEIHNAPGDFYRFSPQAFREVIFRDMSDVEIVTVNYPPNIIGAGYIPKRKSRE